MPIQSNDPPPSQAMPAKRSPGKHSVVYIVLTVLAGLLLFLVMDRDSLVYGMISGNVPFTWDNVWISLKDYGYWLFTLYVISTAVVLFLENRNPDRTLAWLLVLALLPIVGFILYWFVGPNFRYLADRRRFRLPKPRSAMPTDINVDDFSPMMTDSALLMYRTAGARLLRAVEAKPLYDGAEAFDRIMECMRSAEQYILLESYIIKNDIIGNRIKNILIERAKAGVFVCMLYDAVGSWKIGKSFLDALRRGGVHAFPFLPVAFPMFRGANYRNHRKIIVIDGETGFMGGMNIGDEYACISPEYSCWRDTQLEFGGEAVAPLHAIFVNDVAACCRKPELVEKVRNLPVCHRKGGVVPAQIIASGPDTPWDTVHKAFLSVISRSRKKLWITSPYLIPGDALMEAICMASLSGVDVRMLLPGKADHIIVHWASMNCVDELLRAGVRVFLFDPTGFIHAKTIVADGELLSIGSANLDTRSLQINFEVQAFLYDTTLAEEAERVFESDMARSDELTFASWRSRPKIQKVKESVGKLFSSLV